MSYQPAPSGSASNPRPSPARWRRRSVLVASAGGAAAIGWGVFRFAAGQHPPPWHSLEQALEGMRQLQAHSQTQPSSAAARWSWSQTLEHCAQSIEYSLQGYPQLYSPLFQHTAGAAAFALFRARGYMQHDINEPIPSAAPLPPPAPDAASALQRLEAAAQAFLQHSGPLRPHFAYGALERRDYEQAHAMHLAEHALAFTSA